MKLPTLRKIDAKGKPRVWSIRTHGDTIFRMQGLEDGKKITTERQVFGKNLGKVSETSAKEQAKLVAWSMWTKQIGKNYQTIDAAGDKLKKKLESESSKFGGHNVNARSVLSGTSTKNVARVQTLCVDVVNHPVITMQATKWETVGSSKLGDPDSDVPDRIKKYFMGPKDSDTDEFQAYIQPKLDGVRCVAQIQEGTVVLTTRNGKQFPWFSKIREDILEFLTGHENVVLDGELYIHQLKHASGEIVSPDERPVLIKGICSLTRKTPHALEDQIEYHVFDIVDRELVQSQRFKKLKRIFNTESETTFGLMPFQSRTPKIFRVPTKIVRSFKQINSFHRQMYDSGYEGVVIRAFDLKYTPTRSKKMYKFKLFDDSEAIITGTKKDDGVSTEHFRWTCKFPNGVEFTVKPTGTREQKLKWYSKKEKYIGRSYTVKYQGLEPSGKPVFPIGMGFRDDI